MSDNFIKQLDKLSKVLQVLPNKIAAEAVLFSKDRFKSQNWIGNSTQPWKQRKESTGGRQRAKRGVLIDSGRLMRSIRKFIANSNTIVIGTDVPYAEAHNEGFKGTVSVPEHSRTRKGRSGGQIKVKSHTKKMNIPKRQFLGNSAYLGKRLERIAAAEFQKAIK